MPPVASAACVGSVGWSCRSPTQPEEDRPHVSCAPSGHEEPLGLPGPPEPICIRLTSFAAAWQPAALGAALPSRWAWAVLTFQPTSLGTQGADHRPGVLGGAGGARGSGRRPCASLCWAPRVQTWLRIDPRQCTAVSLNGGKDGSRRQRQLCGRVLERRELAETEFQKYV